MMTIEWVLDPLAVRSLDTFVWYVPMLLMSLWIIGHKCKKEDE